MVEDVFDPPPEAPLAPAEGQCCGSGCDPCVWDLWRSEMEQYQRDLADWRARQDKA